MGGTTAVLREGPVKERMDMDHPNADVHTEKDEINPEGASFDLLFGVRRALVVIVVIHS